MKTDIDVMMLFKFDIKYVKLNFNAIASMEFSFDIKFYLSCSNGGCLFMKTIENCSDFPFKNYKHRFFAGNFLAKLLMKNASEAQNFRK